MRKIHQNVPVLFQPYDWKVVETEFKEESNRLKETIFTLANGYIGVRGFFEEGFYGQKEASDSAVMINGIYEYYPYRHIWCRPGFPERFHSIVANVNPIDVKIYVNGERVILGDKVENYSRTLDMYRGVVTREYTYVLADGQKCELCFTRFASQTEKHLFAVDIRVKAPKGAVVRFESTLQALEGTTLAKKAECGSDMPNPFVLNNCTFDGDESLIDYQTKVSGFKIACAVAEESECIVKETRTEESAVVKTLEKVSNGEEIRYSRYCAFATSRDDEKYCALALNVVREAKKAGFDAMLALTEKYWKDYWETSDIRIDGDTLVQQGIRFGLFMINQSAGKDGLTNISANGLTGTAYSGHTFWDTEIFMMPMFLYSHPEIVKQLLIYRYNILPKAKERASQMDDVGALFSWNSINGEECGHVFEAVTAQYHINVDIFYAIYKYYEATGDDQFMDEYGLEILLETSKCLAHRGSFIERKGGKFCINCICGPDEYNPVVDNNLYTNFLTKKQMEFTLQMVESMKARNGERLATLLSKCEVDENELALFRKVADNMYLPYDKENEIYMQDDNFIYKDPIDIDNIPLNKLPLLTNLHPLNLWRYQVCKQADIVLLMFLCSNDFTPEMRKKVFDFYEPKTIHDSSLSAGVHSIVACDIGLTEEAYGYLKQACRMDLDNVNRNTWAGVHAACMGSCYMMIVNGYAGMRVYDDALHFKPFIPENWKGYTFKVVFKGSTLEVAISAQKTAYKLLSGNAITLYDEETVVALDEMNPMVEIKRGA